MKREEGGLNAFRPHERRPEIYKSTCPFAEAWLLGT